MAGRDDDVAGAPGAERSWLAALLVLLPLAALALPSPFELSLDPEPGAAATGWVLLLGLPALAFSLGRARLVRPSGLWLWLLPVIPIVLAGGTDTFEARRALLLFALALSVTLAAAQWTTAERRAVQVGLVAASALFTAVALARGSDAGWGGTLGNSGSLSQAALPGAVIGIAWTLAERGWRVWLGAVAAFAFLAHALAAPVLAACVAVAVALVLCACATRSLRPAVAAVVVLAGLALPLGRAPAPVDPSAPPAATGGVDVRLELWRALPDFFLEAPILGAGPGQFRAAFPPHRTQAEIEASTHGRRLWEETEVEHAHNDWLQIWVEYGVVGGLGWVLLWLLFAGRAWGALRSAESALRVAALAGLGVLAAAAFHSPLLSNPLCVWAAYCLFGMLTAEGGVSVERGAITRFAPLALLATLALPAWRLVRHGAGVGEALRTVGELQEERLEFALEAAPDSPLALGYHARSPGERGNPESLWAAVLERRPHSLEALQQLGLLRVLRGETDVGAGLWYRALEFDPGHPRLLRNLARVELDRGEPELALGHLLTLDEAQLLETEFVSELAANQLFAGRVGPGLAIAALGTSGTLQAQPEELYAESTRLAEAGDGRLSAALAMTAQRQWAHQHARDGDARAASISLRQALTQVRHRQEFSAQEGAAIVRAELAAALWLRGDAEGAREVAAEIEPARLEGKELAEFAREPLGQLGIAPAD